MRCIVIKSITTLASSHFPSKHFRLLKKRKIWIWIFAFHSIRKCEKDHKQTERESVHFIVLWYSRKHLLFTETVNMFRMRSHFFRRMCFCCCCCCFFGKSTHIIFQAPFASAKTNGIIFFLRQISLFRLCSYVYLCAVFFLFLHFSS